MSSQTYEGVTDGTTNNNAGWKPPVTNYNNSTGVLTVTPAYLWGDAYYAAQGWTGHVNQYMTTSIYLIK